MGLSASQARQLLLTAKRNDLEFRAQQISQQRLILSSQLEEIATEYENATSNRQMKINLYLDGQTKDSSGTRNPNKEVNLTYATLVSGCSKLGTKNSPLKIATNEGEENYTATTAYVLRDADGRVVVSDVSEIPGVDLLSETKRETLESQAKEKEYYKPGSSNLKDANYKYEFEVVKDSGTIKVWKTPSAVDEDGNTYYDSSKQVEEEYVLDSMLGVGSTDSNGDTTGPNYLQDCLRNGIYLLEKWSIDPNSGDVKHSGISWDSATSITDRYYTEDDDAAKAKYDRLQNEIQRQDKKLELELDNIETQRSAITTEEESVQKVMDDNIEGTFKTFA